MADFALPTAFLDVDITLRLEGQTEPFHIEIRTDLDFEDGLDAFKEVVALVTACFDVGDDEPQLAAVEPIRGREQRAYGRVVCDVCGQSFAAAGIGVHKARKHSDAPKPAAKPSVAPPASTRPDDEVALRCGTNDCYFAVKVTEIGKLRNHVGVEHGRGLDETERTPRRASDVRLGSL